MSVQSALLNYGNDSYLNEVSDGKKKRFYGQLFFDDAYFSFTATKQEPPNAYAFRGSISLLDPNGDVHLLQGRALREARERQKKTAINEIQPENDTLSENECSARPQKAVNKDRPKAIRNIYLSYDDCDSEMNKLIPGCNFVTSKMLDQIVDGARKLLVLCPEIHSSLHIVIDINHDSLRKLYQRYGGEFLTQKNLGDKEFKTQTRLLQYACARFDDKPIATIQVGDILKIQKSSSKLNDKKIRLLQRFWSYCSDETSMPPNPFLDYKRNYTHKKTRNGELIAKRRGTTTFMDPETEKDLHNAIKPTAAKNHGELSVVLMEDAGATAHGIASLCWKNIVFHDDPEYVQIKTSKDSGPVQTYITPCFSFAAMILHEAYKLAVEKYGENDLLNHHVLEKKNGKPYQAREITALIS